MCGIVAFISKENKPLSIGLDALKRLEYRGYDSAGMAYNDGSHIFCYKSVGRITNLERFVSKERIKSAIYHTRWATHGKVTWENAHPHSDCKNQIYVVHNGIIENYKELKEGLEKEGHVFKSETDTEVLPHLIEKFYQGNLETAVKNSLQLIRGTYGIAVICEQENKIVCARMGSPLLLGIGEGDYLVASDPSAIVGHTKQVIQINDGEILVLTPDSYSIQVNRSPSKIEWTVDQLDKKGYEHYLLKEIHEQPETIEEVIRGRLTDTVHLGGLDMIQLKGIKDVVIVGCGTARHAGLVGEYLFNEYGIPAMCESSSEFRYRNQILNRDSLLIAISQSGETADTLAAIQEAKKRCLCLGITNVVGSTQSRITDAGVYTRTGLEVSVASTKAFTSQIAVLAMIGVSLGADKKIVEELKALPDKIRQVLKWEDDIKELASKWSKYENMMYIGRKFSYPVALEGALKIKEIAYVHAEGIEAGELKHGTLALINENFPCVCVCPHDSVYDKTLSNIEEIKTRNGKVWIVDCPPVLECLSPILTVIPLQLFAYYVALERGCDIDHPRNLAKSVTVE